jgi:hypothetical protein
MTSPNLTQAVPNPELELEAFYQAAGDTFVVNCAIGDEYNGHFAPSNFNLDFLQLLR